MLPPAPSEFLPRLRAIGLMSFHRVRGHIVDIDVPEGSFTNPLALTKSQRPGEDDAATGPSLFQLAEDYMLTRAGLSDRLITIAFKDYKVLGFPVSITNEERYERRVFNFNVCFLFDRDADLAAYEPVARKVGRTLRDLEISESFLSLHKTRARMHSILEQVYEDLSSYSETSICLYGATMLNLRLFPSFPNPPPVRDWDVPVLLVDLQSMRDRSWDLTLYRIIPFIDGVKSVKRIATESDVDLRLAREACQHLLYYNCILMIDIFQYSNCYVLTGGSHSLAATCGDKVGDMVDMGPECAAYCASGSAIPESLKLLVLYSKLRPGLSIDSWMEENAIHTLGVDVRRLITFGVIKGFLRRSHCYPIWLDHPAYTPSQQPPTSENETPRKRSKAGAETTMPYPPSLPGLLDGRRHTDELCLRYLCSFSQLLGHLRLIGTQHLNDLGELGPRGLGRVELVYL